MAEAAKESPRERDDGGTSPRKRARVSVGEDGRKPVALLTGALGGIGSSTAAVLKESGFEVIGMDRSQGESAADHFLQCDIRAFHTDANSVKDTVAKIRTICQGKLDLLVNNAAYQIVKPVEDTTSTDWDLVMSTNVTAPFCLIREFLPELKAARGSIVNVSSIHANLTKPGFVAYATSKGALVSLSRALAVELGEYGVRVNAILPAATATPMLLAGFEGNPEKFKELSSMHPVGRICNPTEIGEFIAFLGSPSSRFITGSELQIDGGIGGRLHDPV